MAPHSSTLAWKIPWTEEPGGLQSMGSQRVGHNWATWLSLFTFHFHALEKEMATHSSVLAWRIPGKGEPGGLPSVGSHRVGYDWSDLAETFKRNHFPQLYWNITGTQQRVKVCWTLAWYIYKLQSDCHLPAITQLLFMFLWGEHERSVP